ncbi:MAG: hypothetical protein O7E52_27440 [Candidatus Poribacteria bacterium]|nr:hypothetical protein [Candidatus Poribacteria bacterium]
MRGCAITLLVAGLFLLACAQGQDMPVETVAESLTAPALETVTLEVDGIA